MDFVPCLAPPPLHRPLRPHIPAKRFNNFRTRSHITLAVGTCTFIFHFSVNAKLKKLTAKANANANTNAILGQALIMIQLEKIKNYIKTN